MRELHPLDAAQRDIDVATSRVSRILAVGLGLALFGAAVGLCTGFLVALAVIVSGLPGFGGCPTIAEIAPGGSARLWRRFRGRDVTGRLPDLS